MNIRLALNELAKTTYKAVQPLQLFLQGPGRKFRGRRELGILFACNARQGSERQLFSPLIAFTIVYGDVRGVGSGPSSIKARPAGLLSTFSTSAPAGSAARRSRLLTCRESHAPSVFAPRCEASTHTSARGSHRQLGTRENTEQSKKKHNYCRARTSYRTAQH
ncbi:unnamed protein product, partial [Trichogramma brassicae]